MTPHEPAPETPPEDASALARILDAYLAELRAGQAPDRAALLAAHPELAAQLESCLAALDFIHRAEHADAAVPPALGDFRIVREIGRGAMGVVYEAEQVSLKRRVALKVLRFGGAAEAEAMERFRREAETVARLHHTNIVPIFAVACEGGVHFFAMQLIEGRSLAAELAQAKGQGRLLDAKVVAGWGVQAAEALAHAHARGVVHRDVKPSNLLLDGVGVVWLTDFGLARRSDEATLTVAGVLLGTPLYMSPEQAAALDRPVDQRSDVYSLGATLYELATGRPVFEAALAKQLLEQIATAEPEAPRRVRPDLPRDLETVLLKCLAKEPGQRYGTAKELADDLRRVVSGDPVKARRPGVLLRLRRWAGRRRKQAPLVAGVAAVAVVATLALGLVGLYWRHAATEARKGSVTLLVEGAAARGEILGSDGKPVMPPFTLPTQAPLDLPGGWYRLRVIRPGLLSEEYELFIEQGQQRTFTVGSNDRQLWEPMPLKDIVAGDFGVLHIATEPGPPGAAGKKDPPPAAVIIKRLVRDVGQWKKLPGFQQVWEQDWFGPAVLWELKLKREDHPTLARLGDAEWEEFCEALQSFVTHNWRDWRGTTPPGRQVLQPAPDLDGDGVGDLIFVCNQFVLAISGKEGKVLWCRELHSKLFLGDKETRTALAGPPFVVADIDGDGHPDLILAHGAVKVQGPEKDHWVNWRYAVFRPCVEALSGRTGDTLWLHEPPNLAERLVVDDGFDMEGKRLKEEVEKGDFSRLRVLVAFSPDGRTEPLTGFASFTERKTRRGRILLAGLFPGLERLDLRTGKPVAPPDLPEPYKEWPPRLYGRYVRAWSADGAIAIVSSFGPARDTGIKSGLWFGDSVMPIDTASGKKLAEDWSQGDDWAVFADLDGDGVPDMIMSEKVVDGATGKLRERRKAAQVAKWSRLWPTDPGVPLVGPDFNGDGWRDLFVVDIVEGERYGHPPGVKVLLARLCSGKDDRALWLTAEPIGKGYSGLHFRERNEMLRRDFAGAAFYWQSAPGAAGYFVVNVVGAGQGAFLFAADTGRLAHVWPGVTVEGIADLDGDGLLDLYGRSGDQLVTVRGTAPEQWRRPGRWRWQWLERSNAPNRVPEPTYLTGPVPHADLVLLFKPNPPAGAWECEAYSGRDGRRLWVQRSASCWPSFDSSLPYPFWVECLDLDGKKRPVVVMWSEYYDRAEVKSSRCALLDGQTGKLRWVKDFPGEPRPDLLYRQADGSLALVYRVPPEGKKRKGGVLVAVNAAGIKVHEAPFPAPEGWGELPLPEGFEFRDQESNLVRGVLRPEDSVSGRATVRLWRFGNWWPNGDWPVAGGSLPEEVKKRMPFPVEQLFDPADSALVRFYDIGAGRLTVLRKGIPSKPAREVPISSYPEEVVLKRPLPWLELARKNAVAGVGNVAGYLAVVAVLALVGRRKTALFLLALFILLPAYSAVFGLVLVLALLLAALPWKTGPEGHKRPLDFSGTVWGKSTLGLLLLPASLLTNVVLGLPVLNVAVESTDWTYPAVLVPLIVLAAAGWKKTALGLLVPCLLLLLYLNWPPLGAISAHKMSLLDFSLLEPKEVYPWSSDVEKARYFTGGTLLPYEAWDWSGWYWLWPWQMGAWQGRDTWHPLVLALVLVGGAELVRWFIRQCKEGAP
jgi:tRNA A-37 threonylcarbamoyl transferase component Bud32